jgi:hypothetical protein
MKILVSTSASKLPELNGVYLLRERKQFIRRGRTISKWETHEKPVKVVALRGQKVMIKNAFGNQTNTKAKGIDINFIGTGKQFKFLPYEKPVKDTIAEKNAANVLKMVNKEKIVVLEKRQKQLRKELADVEKQLLLLQKANKPISDKVSK